MAYKSFILTGIGNITVYKRRGARSMRLSVDGTGKVRLTVPPYVPYQAAVGFAESKRGWIETHAQKQSTLVFENGRQIGKSFRLRMTASFTASRITSRLTGGEILITYPASHNPDEPAVQGVAEAACVRALRREAEEILPTRLRDMAAQHHFVYNSCSIKRLKGRWGSCDQDKNIVLNLFLMQLPWQLIDYVLLHELCHTMHLDHGAGFWQTFLMHKPTAKELRREIRHYQPNFALQAL